MKELLRKDCKKLDKYYNDQKVKRKVVVSPTAKILHIGVVCGVMISVVYYALFNSQNFYRILNINSYEIEFDANLVGNSTLPD